MDLNSCTSRNIDLLSTIENCGTLLASAIGLVYSPSWCGFVAVTPGKGPDVFRPSSREAHRFDVESVFEARVFNEDAELRWLNTDSGRGRAVLVSEKNISGFLDEELEPVPVIEAPENCYLLWGEGTSMRDGLPPNWSRLAMARIGTLDVPYPLTLTGKPANQRNDRLYLLTREYLAVNKDDPYGNVSVIDERLLKIVDEQTLNGSSVGKLINVEISQ